MRRQADLWSEVTKNGEKRQISFLGQTSRSPPPANPQPMAKGSAPHSWTMSGGKPTAGAFKSHGDHRIAMALAVAANALGAESTVSGWPAVESSYPEFANDLARVTDS